MTYDHREGREEMWSRAHPNVQIAWDPTSLRTYMECPRKYQLSIIEGWRPDVLNADILFGLTFGEATGVYDTLRADGAEHDEAQRAAVRHALKRSRGGTDPTTGEELPSLDDADQSGAKTRYAVVRAVVWWAEHWKDDDFETLRGADGKPAVEEGFSIPLGIRAPSSAEMCFQCGGYGEANRDTCGECDGFGAFEKVSGEEYILCGYLDRLARFGDEIYPVERKTTKTTIGAYYWQRYQPDPQIDSYDLMSRVTVADKARGVVVEALQTGKTFARPERKVIKRTEAQAEEWLEEMRRWIRRAERDALEGHWPMNTAACGLHGGCVYRGICSADPRVRHTYLKGSFKRVKWNPLADRRADG